MGKPAQKSRSLFGSMFYTAPKSPISCLEKIDRFFILREPPSTQMPEFISKIPQLSSLVGAYYFEILSGEGVHLFTALEIDTHKQLQNFKYVLNIFTPDGKFLLAIVQRKKLPIKLKGQEAGNPRRYFKMDQMFPSRFRFWEKSPLAFKSIQCYEYNLFNPSAHYHVQWSSGEVLGHIWEGFDHVAVVNADLKTSLSIFLDPISDKGNDNFVNDTYCISACDEKLVGRELEQTVTHLSEIACGFQNHKLITKHLFNVSSTEQRKPLGRLGWVIPAQSGSVLQVLRKGSVQAEFPAELPNEDKALILCVAMTQFCRDSPIVSFNGCTSTEGNGTLKVIICVVVSGILCVFMLVTIVVVAVIL